MRSNKVTQKDVLFLSISFFVVVAMWVGFNIYHTYVTTTISEDLQMQITPIEPTFDIQTITVLQERKKVLPLFDTPNTASSDADISPTPEAEFDASTLFPTPLLSPTLIPSDSVTPSVQPTP